MPETVCPLCDGTGWKIVERNGLSGAKRCSCAIAARTVSILDSANIPPNCEHASLDSFNLPRDNPVANRALSSAMNGVRKFVNDFAPHAERPGLLLIGDPGAGKTHLAVAALRALIAKGHEGIFFDYQNLLDRIRASYNPTSGAADREVYRAAMDTEILLLDDLGARSKVTEWVEDTITSIITYRCNNKKPLIATTNLEMDEKVAYTSAGGTAVHHRTMAEMIGTRARSRLFEMCRIVRIHSVPDYREKHR